MSQLVISDLHVTVAGQHIVRGIDLTVASGEVHVVMGPNGAGKSTLGNALMGHPAYKDVSGSVKLDGVELLGLAPWQRALAGLYLAPQDPVELAGVPLQDVLGEALIALGRKSAAEHNVLRQVMESEATAIGVAPVMLDRPLNADASGGEKKRLETLQLSVLQPRIAVLDELDSGLDIDALRDVARRVEQAVREDRSGKGAGKLGVLAVTHYQRLLEVLRADYVHILVQGRIVASGGPELADQVDAAGYAAFAEV